MESALLSVFVAAIKEQCRYGLIAAANVESLLTQQHESADLAVLSEYIWLWLHTTVNSAANVSKHLWPSDRRPLAGKFPDRGERLRRLLAVAEDSPLHHQNRALRNHLEHLDNRIEHWWATDPSHNIARGVIGPLGTTVVGLQDGSMFEQFDQYQWILAFRGDVYELRPVLEELQAIQARAAVLVAEPWWKWPEPPT